MFSIYNIEGRRFRDSMEKLRSMRHSRVNAKPLLTSNPGANEARAVAAGDSADTGAVVVSSKAVQAYRDMRQLNQREPIYHAHQLMKYPVRTVPIDMGILEAQRYFQEQSLRQMPVVSAQQRIVGLLSLEDLLKLIIIEDEQIQYVGGKRVADVMSMEVITADPVSDIRRIAQVMLDYQLNAVPIVDEQDALIGIVSRSDVLRAVINDPPLTMWS